MAVAQAISNPLQFYNEVSDPRMDEYFLMSSPLPTLGITFAYLILIKYMLPAYMTSRPAFVLKDTIFYYNLFQVILNSVIVYLALHAVYLFYLSKLPEFLDTIFFILRKKESQVSFLHVFHHATMPFNVWLLARVAPGGSSTLISATNSSVHVFMYTYYFLSGLGPRWQRYLWWKKYLTTIQLIQFAYGIIGAVLLIVTSDSCPILKKRFPLLLYGVIYLAVLIFLFAHFYIQSYTKENNNNKIQKKTQ